jgi:uncharacterized protein YgiM (DUF1202 family)
VGAARWVDRLTTGLMVASVAVVVGVATPALLRAAGVELPIASPAAGVSGSPLALPHPPPEIRALQAEGAEGALDADDDDPDPASEPQLPRAAHGREGTTKGTLVLHEQPTGASDVVGTLGAGEQVAVLRVVGDWALVYYGGAGALVVGWTKKSGLSVR